MVTRLYVVRGYGSYTMVAKPIKTVELRYPMSQFSIIMVIFSDGPGVQERSSNRTAGSAGW